MMLDFHANFYAQTAASGKETMYEDDDFDLDKILSDLESQTIPDEWEDVESWSVDQALPED